MHVKRLSVALVVFLAVFSFSTGSARAEWVDIDGQQQLSSSPCIVQVEEREPGVTTVHILIHGFQKTKLFDGGTRFGTIEVPGLDTLRDPGRPALPVVGIPVLLDGPAQVLEVRTTTRSYDSTVPTPFIVRPKRCGGDFNSRMTCDTKTYTQHEPYPSRWAVVKQSGLVRDVDAVLLEVRPFRLFPSQQRLEVAYDIEVDLSAPLFRQGRLRYRSRAFRQVQSFGFHSKALPFARDEAVQEGLLIIAHDSLSYSLDEFVEWKMKSGLEVTLASLSEVGSSYQDVQQYIANAYDNWDNPPVYVLLVGDGNGQGKVPFVPSSYGCASDFLYSTVDGEDLYSDVLVGRISAHNALEAQLQTTKTTWYESMIESKGGSGWIPKSVCISSSEGSGGSNDDVRSDIICGLQADHGYSPTDKLYHSEGNDKASTISEKINAGRGWVNYLGHGSGHDWATTTPPYSVSHIAQLQNPYKLPFIVDVSCSNGEFDSTAGDCFAEVWMKTGTLADLRAAVAVYSSSTPTSWDEPAEMAVGMTHALLEQGIFNWGALAAAGRAYMMDVLPSGGLAEVCHQYVVFGDPSLMVRTQAAVSLDVEHPEAIPLGGVEFPAAVTSSGQPVVGATVSLMLPDSSVIVGKTDDSGSANLWVDASAVGGAQLTVFAANSLVYTAPVETLVPGCALVQAKPAYANCSTELELALFDADLNLSDVNIDSAVVTVKSSSAPASKNVPLEEAEPAAGKFVGTIQLTSDPGQFELGVEDGDTVELSYFDEECSDGTGKVAVSVDVDCEPPQILGVKAKEVDAVSALVAFTTSEEVVGVVRLGETSPPTKEFQVTKGTLHNVALSGLVPSTKYFFDIEVQDVAANVTIADDGGQYYQFTTVDCEPECSGKQCGLDGCGGDCGGCCEGQTCQEGSCIGGAGCEISYDPGCGGCSCETCVCGMDPYCCSTMWDGLCVDECVEQCGGCGAQANCAGKECGPNGCGGKCGDCPEAWVCTDDGKCVDECEADCVGKTCGSNGCGGSCGECDEEATCKGGACLYPCGDVDFVGCCDGQTHVYCDEGFEFKVDCSELELKCGWKDSVGWYECVDEQAADPSGKHPLWCPGSCPPQCDGKECGPDACGGTCGKCGTEETCEDGLCQPVCKPDCDGKECGEDGCGDVCGDCGIGEVCSAGLCDDVCVPDCEARECGDDNCGGTCGKCVPGMECSGDFLCVVPSGEPDVVSAEEVEPVAFSGGGGGGGCEVVSGTGSAGAAWLLLLMVIACLGRARLSLPIRQDSSRRTT